MAKTVKELEEKKAYCGEGCFYQAVCRFTFR